MFTNVSFDLRIFAVNMWKKFKTYKKNHVSKFFMILHVKVKTYIWYNVEYVNFNMLEKVRLNQTN